jgi:thioredoxin-like negative regulator of GroEL
MSGLLFLQQDDFFIQNASKGGTILCNSIRGISVILFYSTNCEFCKKLIPIFKRLPGQIGGVQFGMANVSSDPNVVRMSRETIAPIKYVPLIILYFNGRPHIRYDNALEERDIKQFVYEVGNRIQSQARERAQEDKKSGKKPSPSDDIPDYTIGKPLYGHDEVTYLEFDEAYEVKHSKR